MNLNQNYVSKLLFLQSIAYIPRICWNLDLNFTLYHAHSHGGIRSVPKYFCANWILLCSQKFVLNIYHNKTNLSPLTGYFALQPQNLPTGLLYASLHFQTCGILTVLTSESANVSDFSPHITSAVSWHRICDLTVAMIDKTLIAFINRIVIRSLCLL